VNEKYLENILIYFSKIMSHEIPEDLELNDDIKQDILEKIRIERAGKNEFAEYGTKLAQTIQHQLNTGYKQKQHRVEDAYELNKATIKLFLSEYAKNKRYTINFKNFDWQQLDLFMGVTGRYFNELETTPTMKMQPNDIVDWLNLMYVTPLDKYITCEKKWRRYITEDIGLKSYLYENINCPK
ncbi:MAG: hypothetical protein WD512_08645, partial [Candidatus Paceibacterota bacterium]